MHTHTTYKINRNEIVLKGLLFLERSLFNNVKETITNASCSREAITVPFTPTGLASSLTQIHINCSSKSGVRFSFFLPTGDLYSFNVDVGVHTNLKCYV